MSTPEELEARVRRIDLEVAQVSPDSPMNSPLEMLRAYNYDPSHDLWTSARSKIRNILRRFPNQPLEEIEFDLHDLWDTIIRTAFITNPNDPGQDRLVAEVVLARELGSLGPNATTADGEVLSGLPFLVGDITAACLGKLKLLEQEERRNLAAFVARLVAVGVRAPELGSCALFMLRETLETPFTAKDEENRIAKRLPAVVAWFNFAGHRLAVFSGGNGHKPLSGEEGTLTTVGKLAREAGILEPGFSTKRWHFWRQRLEALSSYANVDMIRRPALQGKKIMDMWSEYVGLVVE